MRGALWMALLLMAGACSSSEHDDAALQPVLIEPPAEEQELPTESLQGMWTEILPISVARNGVGIASDDDALFLVGGFDNLSGTTTAIRFALDGSGESLLPELPEPVAGASVFVRDGALYVMGGLPALQPSGASVPHESCSWLELATGVWSACAAMGNGATSHAAEAWPSDARPSAFLFGGLRSIDLSSGSLPTKVVQRYDFEVDAWVAETALPEFRDGAAVTMVDGVAYVVGGRTLSQGQVMVPAAVLTYDLATHAWADDRVASVLTPRVGTTCAARRGFLYCFGGYDRFGVPLDVVERLEFATGQWSAMTPIPAPRYDAVAIARSDAILLVGGNDPSDAPTTSVFMLQ